MEHPLLLPANGLGFIGHRYNIVNLSTGTTNPILQPHTHTCESVHESRPNHGFAVSGPSTVYTTYSGGQSFLLMVRLELKPAPTGYGGNVPNPTNHPRQFNGGVRYRIVRMDLTMQLPWPSTQLWFAQPTTDNRHHRHFGTNQISALTLNWEVNGLAQPPIPVSQLLDTITGNGFYSPK